MEKKNKQYAGQIVDIARTSQRLTIADHISKMTENEGEPFLNVFSKRSIYLVSIFNFGGDMPASVTANIPLRDLAEIKSHTELATKEIFKRVNKLDTVTTADKDDADISDSVANRKLKMGSKNIAGFSPIEILLRDGDNGVSTLTNQISFLSANVSKYPKNQTDIDAINEGLRLYRAGKLSGVKVAASTSSGRILKIYDRPDKYFKEKNNKGCNRCYNISIVCDPEKDSPYRVTIKNYYAPVLKKDNGATPIQYSAREDEKVFYIDLLEGEWLNALEMMEENEKAARYIWYKNARDNDDNNRWSKD